MSKTGSKESPGTTMRALLPGSDVLISEYGVKVRIYPLGIGHFPVFERVLGRLISVMIACPAFEKLTSKDDEEKKQAQIAVGNALSPVLLDDGLQLIEACCRVHPEEIETPNGKVKIGLFDIPAHYMPVIVGRWAQQSFGEQYQRDPWKRLLEQAIEQLSGVEVKIVKADSSQPSNPQSPAGTSSPTSSNEGSQVSRTEGGPIPSSSSGPGSQQST